MNDGRTVLCFLSFFYHVSIHVKIFFLKKTLKNHLQINWFIYLFLILVILNIFVINIHVYVAHNIHASFKLTSKSSPPILKKKQLMIYESSLSLEEIYH
jgi:hypothetical protein